MGHGPGRGKLSKPALARLRSAVSWPAKRGLTQQLDRTGRREAEQHGLNSARATRTGLPSPVGTGIGLIRACQQNPLPLRVTWHGDGDWDATDRLEGTHAAGGTGF